MRDVRLSGVEEDGQHLVLDLDGEELRLAVDDALRTAMREASQLKRRADDPDAPVREYTPREIQTMMRAGKSVQDVAVDSGWTPERVSRYEGPILAEREHIASLARAVVLRGRASATTLDGRVRSRLQERGVTPEDAHWDAIRPEGSPWVVRLDFVAGDKERRATWDFDLAGRRLTATNDEARWLGEDEASPAPATPLIPQSRGTSRVFDVEAEGGLDASRPVHRPQQARRSSPRRADGHSEPVDLMTAMRERSAARQKRGRTAPAAPETAPADTAPEPEDTAAAADKAPVTRAERVPGELENQALPLEGLDGLDPAEPDMTPPGHEQRDAEGTSTGWSEPEPGDTAFSDAEATDTERVDTAQFDPQGLGYPPPASAPRREPVELEAWDEEDAGSTAPSEPAAPERAPRQPRAEADAPPPVVADASDPDDSPAPAEESVTSGKTGAGQASRAKKGSRRSVPSWDDIMFGKKD